MRCADQQTFADADRNPFTCNLSSDLSLHFPRLEVFEKPLNTKA